MGNLRRNLPENYFNPKLQYAWSEEKKETTYDPHRVFEYQASSKIQGEVLERGHGGVDDVHGDVEDGLGGEGGKRRHRVHRLD